jgi:hypothetical protein
MRQSNQETAARITDGKHDIAGKIDPRRIARQHGIARGMTETQIAVIGIEGEQMAQRSGTARFRQAENGRRTDGWHSAGIA